MPDTGESGVQSHPLLNRKFEASLGNMRPRQRMDRREGREEKEGGREARKGSNSQETSCQHRLLLGKCGH